MTINVKVGEAKTHLSELLVKAEAGEEVIISRGDQPVVRLVAIRNNNSVKAAIASILEVRATAKPVSLEEIIEWRDEGRR